MTAAGPPLPLPHPPIAPTTPPPPPKQQQYFIIPHTLIAVWDIFWATTGLTGTCQRNCWHNSGATDVATQAYRQIRRDATYACSDARSTTLAAQRFRRA